MTPKEINNSLKESKYSFEKEIPCMLRGYEERIKITDKLQDMMDFTRLQFPNNTVEMVWYPDRESYCPSRIWFKIDFKTVEELRQVNCGSVFMDDFKDRFMINTNLIGFTI